jgi:hypothetical protein
MRRLFFSLPSIFVLTACFPVDVYHKTGATMQRQQSDLVTCQAKALQSAPVDIRTGRTPTYYVPERRTCHKTATGQDCRIYGGYWEGGEIYTYDANEQLRSKLQQQCMSGKGYAKVRLPRCEREQIAAAGQVSARMPRLTKQSCVAKGVGGEWVVIGG